MLPESVKRFPMAASISALVSVWSSRDVLVNFGRPSTPGGWSHSWVTPTKALPAPTKWTISVALGRRETTRKKPPLELLLAKVAQEARLADIVHGEHADQLAAFHHGDSSETALLQDAVAIRKKVGVRRDRRDVGLHQVADAPVPLRRVGGGQDLITRDHANELSVLVYHREVLLVAVDDGVQDLPEVVVRCNGLGATLGTHDIRHAQAPHELALADHL